MGSNLEPYLHAPKLNDTVIGNESIIDRGYQTVNVLSY